MFVADTQIKECKHVGCVSTAEAVLTERFNAKTNAFYYPRSLDGDFEGLAIHLKKQMGLGEKTLKAINENELRSLIINTDAPIMLAAAKIIEDLRLVQEFGYVAKLRVLVGNGYTGAPSILHHDTFRNGRVLCSYTEPSTYGTRNQDVDVISGATYRLKPGASPFPLGLMHLWRFATNGQSEETKPFVHTPMFLEQNLVIPRLLLAGR